MGMSQVNTVPSPGPTVDFRSASAAVQSASNPIAQTIALVGNWAINHTPASNTQATISRAAGAAGVRHICTSISGTFFVDTAGVPAAVTLNLRDGATGAGAILWSRRLSVAGLAVGAAVGVEISGLSIYGSAATAMTLECSAAGGLNTFETVALTGYTVV